MIYLGDQLPFPTSSSIAIHPGLVLKQCRLHRTLSTEVLPQTGLLYTLYIYEEQQHDEIESEENIP